jgi:hypothetical protein
MSEQPILKEFAKEQLETLAKEFMRLRFGRVADLSLQDKRYYHEVTGILMFYVNHVWGEFGCG